jgi:dTDP-4-amino-4,6-dideoxygalactose transaminase
VTPTGEEVTGHAGGARTARTARTDRTDRTGPNGWTVGGEMAIEPFELALPARPADRWLDRLSVAPPRPRALVGSGREALRLVLADARRRGRRRVVVPAYVCDAVVAPARALGFEVVTVDVDRRGAPHSDALVAAVGDTPQRTTVVTAAPFGFPYPAGVLDALVELGVRGVDVVEDRTHSLFGRFPMHATRGIASLRKWCAIGDGGVAYGAGVTGVATPPDDLFARARHDALVAKHAWQRGGGSSEDEFLAALQAAETHLDAGNGVHAMSAPARHLLGRVDVAAVVAARRHNYLVLLDELDGTPGLDVLFPNLPDAVCPFAFAVLVDSRDDVRARLAAERVFCPVHWPQPDGVDAPGASALAARELTIPCDQRYDGDDMVRVARMVREAVRGASGACRPPRTTARLVDVDDDRWDDEMQAVTGAGRIPVDPTCGRGVLRATATVRGGRPVLVVAEGDGWRAAYPLVVDDVGDGVLLARTPEDGGPLVATRDARAALLEVRATVDAALRDLGVASEVALLGPWTAHRDDVAVAWSARPEKTICISGLVDLDARRAELSSNMRRDITRARRALTETWSPLDAENARHFARRYAEHMDRLGAAERWRLDEAYFAALADDPDVDAWVGEATDAPGDDGDGANGAAVLVVVSGSVASYVYGTRWGRSGAATTLALWRAHEELAARGVRELLLGGGVTTADDDSLLRFKRRFAPREAELLISARVFDRDAPERAVARGAARPLPGGAVE